MTVLGHSVWFPNEIENIEVEFEIVVISHNGSRAYQLKGLTPDSNREDYDRIK